MRSAVFGVGAFVLLGGSALAAPRWLHQDTRACRATDRVLSTTVTPRPLTGNVAVANMASSTTSLVDLAAGTVVDFKTPDEPHDAVISPDGRWAVVSTFGPTRGNAFLGNRLYIIDVARKRLTRTIETGEHRGLHDLEFRPGHPTRFIVTAQTSRNILELDVETGSILAAIPTDAERSHLVALTADGNTAFTTNEGSGTVARLDLVARKRVASFPVSVDVEGITVTANGRELWVGEKNAGAISVRDAMTGAVLKRFDGFRYPDHITTTRDRRRVIISDPGCKMVVVADAATRTIEATYRAPAGTMVGDVGPDNRTAYSTADERDLIVFDLETGALFARHRIGGNPHSLGWAPAPR